VRTLEQPDHGVAAVLQLNVGRNVEPQAYLLSIAEAVRVMQVRRAFVERVLARNDPLALAAASEGLLAWDGFDAADLELPSLHYAGEEDPLLRAVKLASERMPESRFVQIPELDHLTAFSRSDQVLPHVLGFLQEQPALD
jgi:pimeloyl-ACP methyl ester carboxylesterase